MNCQKKYYFLSSAAKNPIFFKSCCFNHLILKLHSSTKICYIFMDYEMSMELLDKDTGLRKLAKGKAQRNNGLLKEVLHVKKLLYLYLRYWCYLWKSLKTMKILKNALWMELGSVQFQEFYHSGQYHLKKFYFF